MSSLLASFISIGFILWFFIHHTQSSPRLSTALWIPTIWVAIIASRPMSSWMYGNAVRSNVETVFDGSPVDRAIFLVLIIAGTFLLAQRTVDWRFFARNNRLLIGYYLFCCISILWSEYPFVAFKRWSKEIGTLLMILLILTENSPIEAIRKTFLRCTFLLIPLSVLQIKYYMVIGRSYNPWTGEAMLCGVTTDKNALGRLCFLSMLILLWTLTDRFKGEGWMKLFRRRIPEFLTLILSSFLLVKADSSTSKACFVVGVIAIICIKSNGLRGRIKWAGPAGVLFLILSFTFLSVPACRSLVAENLGRKADLTDRIDIWSEALALRTNPLIGAGYGSVWLTREGEKLKSDMQIAHSHNGYLETYLNTGLIGLALLLGVVRAAGVNSLRKIKENSPYGAILAALFFSCVIYNSSEVGFDYMSWVGFILWLLAIRIKPGVQDRTW